MSESNEIKQSQSIGAQGTQVGIQNNYIGMSPQAASELAINLFIENFPKLQEEASKVAKERVDALRAEIIEKLNQEGVKDFSVFKEPDVQFILVEAQQKYARFGTAEKLEILSGLICKRIQNDRELVLKVTLDKAIEIASMLTDEQLDLLTLLFLCKRVMYTNINSVEQFRIRYEQAIKPYNAAGIQHFSYLLTQGCLQLNISSAIDFYSKKMGVPRKELENACSPFLAQLMNCDYAPSDVGIVLAIMNIERKTGEKYDLNKWIQ